MKPYDIIVIGAGAAGMMAAGTAATRGARVLLLEKMNRPGRKLKLTGMGRCNITNNAPIAKFITHFGKNGRFLRQSLHRFSPDNLVEFFNSRGVETVDERGGRVFPKSQSAKEIVDALLSYAVDSGVTIFTDITVRKLLIEEGRITGVECVNSKEHPAVAKTYHSDKVIIATGGKSYPGTGSTGAGYKWAREAGHTVVPVSPALVPLETAESIPREVAGLSLRNVSASLWIDNKKADDGFGEVEFTRHGLSGPITLTLSKQVVEALDDDKNVEMVIDLKPALDMKKLDNRLLRDLDTFGKKRLYNILRELLPQKLINYCLAKTRLDADKLGHQVTAEERKRLRIWLKEVRFKISGHRSYKEAIVTVGGVSLKEVDPKTMESKLVSGLYWTGEVLDLDADTGGFNLQAAFSTGRMAGLACVGKL